MGKLSQEVPVTCRHNLGEIKQAYINGCDYNNDIHAYRKTEDFVVSSVKNKLLFVNCTGAVNQCSSSQPIRIPDKIIVLYASDLI